MNDHVGIRIEEKNEWICMGCTRHACIWNGVLSGIWVCFNDDIWSRHLDPIHPQMLDDGMVSRRLQEEKALDKKVC
jgi:hypothetical protein